MDWPAGSSLPLPGRPAFHSPMKKAAEVDDIPAACVRMGLTMAPFPYLLREKSTGLLSAIGDFGRSARQLAPFWREFHRNKQWPRTHLRPPRQDELSTGCMRVIDAYLARRRSPVGRVRSRLHCDSFPGPSYLRAIQRRSVLPSVGAPELGMARHLLPQDSAFRRNMTAGFNGITGCSLYAPTDRPLLLGQKL